MLNTDVRCVRCCFWKNYMLGKGALFSPATIWKHLSCVWRVDKVFTNRKNLTYLFQKHLLTGDKTKWLFGTFKIYNQKTYSRNICVEQRCHQSLGPLWYSEVGSWILDMKTGHLSKIYVIHTNDMLHISGMSNVWIFSHWMASVIFWSKVWKISYIHTFCLQVLWITYLCYINTFSSLKLLITVFKEERWSWKKARKQNSSSFHSASDFIWLTKVHNLQCF